MGFFGVFKIKKIDLFYYENKQVASRVAIEQKAFWWHVSHVLSWSILWL
jgi:hypothetical protein